MRRLVGSVLLGLAGAVLAFPVLSPAPAGAEVSVNINIGPPAFVVHEPPEMVIVPRSLVYWAPGVEVDLFFHLGYWWTPRGDRWYRAKSYNGPWRVIDRRHVPREVVVVPRDYRKAYAHEHRVPYGQLKKHWRGREIERREHRGEWREDRREHRKDVRREMKRDGKEYRKEMKRDGKEYRKEMKRDEKEYRKEMKEHGRGRD